MRNLKTIEGKVRAVLQKDKEARNDDMLLYLKVCKRTMFSGLFSVRMYSLVMSKNIE